MLAGIEVAGDLSPVAHSDGDVVLHAIVDALSEFGVREFNMPATPERVWRAINEARKT